MRQRHSCGPRTQPASRSAPKPNLSVLPASFERETPTAKSHGLLQGSSAFASGAQGSHGAQGGSTCLAVAATAGAEAGGASPSFVIHIT